MSALTENGTSLLPAYGSLIEVQEDVIGWIRLLVERLIQRKPPGARPSEDGTSALAIRPEELEAFLGSPVPPPGTPGEPGDALQLKVAAQWSRLQERLHRSAADGHDLPVERLRGFFSLGERELQIVLALFGPEVEEEVLRAYRYAWNDFTRKRIEVGFLLDLLGTTATERDELRCLLSPEAALRHNRLVTIGPEIREAEEQPFLGRSIRLANRLVDFLRGEDRLDETLFGLCRRIHPVQTLDELLLPQSVRENVRVALAQRRGRAAAPIILQGPVRVGKRSLAEALANDLGRPFLVGDLDAIFEDPRPTEELLALVIREANLSGGILYLAGSVGLPEELSRTRSARLAALLERNTGPLFLGLTTIPEWLKLALPAIVTIVLPVPSPEEREQLWRRAIPKGIRLGKAVDLAELAQRYSLTGGALQRAASMAAQKALRRSSRWPSLSMDDLESASRSQITHKLGTLAMRIQTRFSWKDFILPEEELARLMEIAAFARNRRKVFEEWGFDSKVPYGKGLSALFSGPPGTGKTMAAGIIARELGLELFKVDLSRIVDKYIGETEKNLGRVFDEATESHAMLLFDEADSLFSKRTEVRSSVDRYANLEVNYLLQRMEDFEGVTVLTTNFDAGFDDAFRRRIKFRITFPFPDPVDRERLWKSMFPKDAKLAKTVDWKKLAVNYEMSGGHIKNAALRSAFLTAERGKDEIDTEAMWEAARFEYIEMGKLVRD